MNLRSRGRLQSAATVALVSIAAVTGAGCVPDPGGPPATTTTTTTTVASPWLAAGCYPNATLQLLAGSVQFSGEANQLGNALQHFTTDGTCTSASPSVETIVRAPDAASALASCQSLGGAETFVSASNLSQNGWNVPTDAWFCQGPFFP